VGNPRLPGGAGEKRHLHGWMNIRELRWRRWGNEDRAWALGVIRRVPARLRRDTYPLRKRSRGSPRRLLGGPVGSSCGGWKGLLGTSYFYYSMWQFQHIRPLHSDAPTSSSQPASAFAAVFAWKQQPGRVNRRDDFARLSVGGSERRIGPQIRPIDLQVQSFSPRPTPCSACPTTSAHGRSSGVRPAFSMGADTVRAE
jgi:hypothetical protein